MALLTPLFLLGLGCLAIPIWLHLMNRSDPPAQPFSSTLLLKHSDQITSSERSLRYWFLLVLRLLALLILILLFAQPAMRVFQSENSGPTENNVILLLDRSLSMSAGQRWSSAQDRLNQLLDSLPAGTSAQLLAASDRLELVQEPTTDFATIRASVQRLRPDQGELNMAALIAAADDLAAGLPGTSEIHLFSDLQASNLPTRFSDLVPSRAPLQLHPVGDDESSNASLTAAYSGSDIQAWVQWQGFGSDQPLPTISLHTDGELLASAELQQESGGLWSARFEQPEFPRDTRTLEVRLDLQDSLLADNRYFLAPPAANSVRALVLSATASLNDSLYLRTALQSLSDPQVEVDVQYAGGGVNFALDDYQLVLLNDAGALSDGIGEALESWVGRGGNLLLVAGSRVSNGENIPISGGRLQLSNGSDQQGLLMNNSRHSAFSRFASNSLAAELYQPRQLSGFSGNVLVQTSAGWPWMIEQTRGAGRILLLAHSLAPDATSLSLQPEFVPLLRSLVSWMAEINRLPRQIKTGDRILLGASSSGEESSGAPVIQQLFLANGSPLLGLSEQGQRRTYRIDEPGLYGLQTASGLHHAAANIPLAETSLAAVEPQLLQRWRELASPENIQVVDNTAVAGESMALLPEWRTWENWLLPALLALLLAEALFANAHLRVRRESLS